VHQRNFPAWRSGVTSVSALIAVPALQILDVLLEAGGGCNDDLLAKIVGAVRSLALSILQVYPTGFVRLGPQFYPTMLHLSFLSYGCFTFSCWHRVTLSVICLSRPRGQEPTGRRRLSSTGLELCCMS
jgi:hypothetical protein